MYSSSLVFINIDFVEAVEDLLESDIDELEVKKILNHWKITKMDVRIIQKKLEKDIGRVDYT